MGRLLYENDDVFYFQDKPGVTYIKMATIKPFYELLNVKVINDISVQQFFDLLQSAGEEQNLMELQYQELDEYVALRVRRVALGVDLLEVRLEGRWRVLSNPYAVGKRDIWICPDGVLVGGVQPADAARHPIELEPRQDVACE